MDEHYGKIRVCSLLKIKAHTFGVFRPFGRPGATFWRLSQPTVPRSDGPFGVFRPCNRPGGACQEACVNPFPPIGAFRSFASPAHRTSAGSAPGLSPSGGNPRPRNGTARGPRGRAASFWHFRPRTRSGGNLLVAFRNHRPRQRHPFWRFFVPAPGGPLAAALWHLSSSQPLLQTAVCTSDRGSCTKKEAAWGRRRPLGRGMCALKGTRTWGTLC